MAIVMVSLTFGVVFAWWLAPQMTSVADRRLSRHRLSATMPTNQLVVTPRLLPPPRQSQQPVNRGAIDIAEEIARQTRSGIHARDVVLHAMQSCLSPQQLLHMSPIIETAHINDLLSTASALSRDNKKNDLALMFHMLNGACVDAVFAPLALDHVVNMLRAHRSLHEEIRTAASQALFTSRILTYLPLIALAILLLFSSHTRDRLFDVPMMFFLGIGIVINRCGALWIRQIVRRVMDQPIDEVVLLAENLVASLRAGCSLTVALERWKGVSPLGTQVSDALRAGTTLEQALRTLPQSAAISRLQHTIESSYKDGLPIVHTVHRLVDDARSTMRHRSEILIRQLPTRLSFPLVFCILPSFLFITVIPLMMNALASLAPALSPTITSLS